MKLLHGQLVLPRDIGVSARPAFMKAFVAHAKVEPKALVFVHQVHGNTVLDADAGGFAGWAEVGQADSLLTTSVGIVLVIRTADCVPLVFFDPVKAVVAVAHAGYQGILAGVIEKTVQAMQQKGSQPKDMQLFIGSAICAKHYDVSQAKDNRVKRFEERFTADDQVVLRQEGEIRLDLSQACRVIALSLGIKADQITASQICTFETAALPSHRREGEKRFHNLWTWACLKAD